VRSLRSGCARCFSQVSANDATTVCRIAERISKKTPIARGICRPREIREKVGESKAGVLGIRLAIVSVSQFELGEKGKDKVLTADEEYRYESHNETEHAMRDRRIWRR